MVCKHRWLCNSNNDPDGYCPARCLKCGATTKFEGYPIASERATKKGTCAAGLAGRVPRDEVWGFLSEQRIHTSR